MHCKKSNWHKRERTIRFSAEGSEKPRRLVEPATLGLAEASICDLDPAMACPQVFTGRVRELDWLFDEPSRIRQSPLFEVRSTHDEYAPQDLAPEGGPLDV